MQKENRTTATTFSPKQKPNLEHSVIVGSLEKCNITFAWGIRRRTNEAEEILKLMTGHQTD